MTPADERRALALHRAMAAERKAMGTADHQALRDRRRAERNERTRARTAEARAQRAGRAVQLRLEDES